MGQFNFNSQPAPWSLNWLQQFLYSLLRSWWARCSTTAQLWLPQSTTPSTRLETCLTPDSACRLLAPCYQSKCTQKYVYHRMLSVDPCDPYRGFFIDTYKLPSACSCHVP